ncbi:class II histocompatibility antigen, B-L beta chain-like isoform X3 [Anas acuta]|uniref:class II histocompatibility antigen, B-L beta chain-like isoform X3 n=1 Tax=Anas acuta TaxID=28680 RepID=UPI0035C8ACB7
MAPWGRYWNTSVVLDKCQRESCGDRFCLVTGDAAQPRCSLVVTGTPSPSTGQSLALPGVPAPLILCPAAMGSGRILGAGAVLVALVVLGARPAGGEETKVEPKVRVSPMQSSSLPQTDRLACYVTGFYPAEIQVKWFKNGQEETKHVVSTDVIQNGDWTYQVLVMLESTPQHGDTYECHVQHASLKSPITYKWVLPGDAARGKMLTGVGGLVLGLIFLALGLFLYVRRKGASLPRLQGS